MNAFTSQDFAVGQVYDMAEVLVQVSPKQTPFLTFMQSKAVKAHSPHVHFIEETLSDSAVTMPEGGDAPDFVKDALKARENFLQIWGATATVTNTAKYSMSTTASDLLAYEVDKKTRSIARAMEKSFFYNKKGKYDAVSKVYTTTGLIEQIDPANKITGASFDQANFESLLEKLYDEGVGNDMVMFLPARLKQDIINTNTIQHLATDNFLGFDFENYVTSFGTVRMVLAPELKDTAVVVNPEYLQMPVLIPLHGEVECASGSKQSVYIETQAGINLLNSKSAAVFEITPAP